MCHIFHFLLLLSIHHISKLLPHHWALLCLQHDNTMMTCPGPCHFHSKLTITCPRSCHHHHKMTITTTAPPMGLKWWQHHVATTTTRWQWQQHCPCDQNDDNAMSPPPSQDDDSNGTMGTTRATERQWQHALGHATTTARCRQHATWSLCCHSSVSHNDDDIDMPWIVPPPLWDDISVPQASWRQWQQHHPCYRNGDNDSDGTTHATETAMTMVCHHHKLMTMTMAPPVWSEWQWWWWHVTTTTMRWWWQQWDHLCNQDDDDAMSPSPPPPLPLLIPPITIPLVHSQCMVASYEYT